MSISRLNARSIDQFHSLLHQFPNVTYTSTKLTCLLSTQQMQCILASKTKLHVVALSPWLKHRQWISLWETLETVLKPLSSHYSHFRSSRVLMSHYLKQRELWNCRRHIKIYNSMWTHKELEKCRWLALTSPQQQWPCTSSFAFLREREEISWTSGLEKSAHYCRWHQDKSVGASWAWKTSIGAVAVHFLNQNEIQFVNLTSAFRSIQKIHFESAKNLNGSTDVVFLFSLLAAAEVTK